MDEFSNISKKNTLLKILRWTARIIGTLFVLTYLFFVSANIFEHSIKIHSHFDWLNMVRH